MAAGGLAWYCLPLSALDALTAERPEARPAVPLGFALTETLRGVTLGGFAVSWSLLISAVRSHSLSELGMASASSPSLMAVLDGVEEPGEEIELVPVALLVLPDPELEDPEPLN